MDIEVGILTSTLLYRFTTKTDKPIRGIGNQVPTASGGINRLSE